MVSSMALDPHPSPDPLPPTFAYREARALGVSDRRIRQLVVSGVVRRIGRGLYRRADAALADEELLEISMRAPGATLCLVTALAHHGLTDHVPDRIDAALPRRRRPPRTTAPVHWHRFDEATYDLGREPLAIDTVTPIGIYTAERSIVDAFRLRYRQGHELAVEALRRWLPRRGSNPAELLALARHFPKAEPALREALRILL